MSSRNHWSRSKVGTRTVDPGKGIQIHIIIVVEIKYRKITQIHLQQIAMKNRLMTPFGRSFVRTYVRHHGILPRAFNSSASTDAIVLLFYYSFFSYFSRRLVDFFNSQQFFLSFLFLILILFHLVWLYILSMMGLLGNLRGTIACLVLPVLPSGRIICQSCFFVRRSHSFRIPQTSYLPSPPYSLQSEIAIGFVTSFCFIPHVYMEMCSSDISRFGQVGLWNVNGRFYIVLQLCGIYRVARSR